MKLFDNNPKSIQLKETRMKIFYHENEYRPQLVIGIKNSL